MIGDNVKVAVLDVSGKQVRLGIAAPASVQIHRQEIYQRIQANNRDRDVEKSTSF